MRSLVWSGSFVPEHTHCVVVITTLSLSMSPPFSCSAPPCALLQLYLFLFINMVVGVCIDASPTFNAGHLICPETVVLDPHYFRPGQDPPTYVLHSLVWRLQVCSMVQSLSCMLRDRITQKKKKALSCNSSCTM